MTEFALPDDEISYQRLSITGWLRVLDKVSDAHFVEKLTEVLQQHNASDEVVKPDALAIVSPAITHRQ